MVNGGVEAPGSGRSLSCLAWGFGPLRQTVSQGGGLQRIGSPAAWEDRGQAYRYDAFQGKAAIGDRAEDYGKRLVGSLTTSVAWNASAPGYSHGIAETGYGKPKLRKS